MLKPYYEQDGIAIYHGDCREILPKLSNRRYSCIVTDPPYGQTSLKWDRWPDGWLYEAALRSDSLWCFGTLRMFMDHALEFSLAGWGLAQDVIWEKHNGSGFQDDRFKRVHEQPAQFYQGRWDAIYKAPIRVPYSGPKKGIKTRGQTAHLGKIGKGEYAGESAYVDDGTRLQRSVIRVRSCQGSAENETQKPLGIIAPLLKYSVPQDGIVLDMFGGAGSVAVTARFLGLRAVVIEIREHQCEATAKRLQSTLPLEMGA